MVLGGGVVIIFALCLFSRSVEKILDGMDGGLVGGSRRRRKRKRKRRR